MKWIKVPWGNLEVVGCSLLSFGIGLIVGITKNLSIIAPSLLVLGILLTTIGLWCALYSHGTEFDKLHNKNEE